MALVRAFHGDPIVGKSLYWVGEGDVPNNGLGVQNHWFVRDRTALGVGVDWTRFETEDDQVPALDAEGRLRWWALEQEENVALFLDFLVGVIVSEDPIPPEGTEKNGTFGWGTGLEVPLTGPLSLMVGVEWHHMSNARGRHAEDNPSQNEFLSWAGLGFRW